MKLAQLAHVGRGNPVNAPAPDVAGWGPTPGQLLPTGYGQELLAGSKPPAGPLR
jgi:hypothetical protein